ncbi:MAG: hypothetical protein K2R98_02585 [Gemmataceae bacterium]|nr:hypothetical protein [Gemmataceae bacterium]
MACLLLATVPALLATVGLTWGQFNERDVKKQINAQDTDQVWMLDFRFKDPRLITVDIPGRGKRVVWYMWYQVINNTKEARTFIPDFELVTLDKHTAHHDQVLPKAEEAIKRIEDPTGYLDIKNSVTIASHPIPVTKPDAAPRVVTGVAIWDDVFQKEPDTTRFSIFVSGLSNGWSRDDPKEKDGKEGAVRRKTLQLNFKRLRDRAHLDTEVKFLPPSEWIYRAVPLKGDENGKMEKEKDKEK